MSQGVKNSFTNQIDLVLAQVIYVVIRSFFKYLVCNIRGGAVFERTDFHEFFVYSIKFFTDKFNEYKGEFTTIYKILKAKTQRIQE